MTERRPHWSDDLIVAVGDAIEHADPTVHPTVGIVNDVIAAVEDWHKAKRDSRIRTHSEGCWRWHTECAESLIEYQQAAIARVRELCSQSRAVVHVGCRCSTDECSGKCGAGKPLAWNLDPADVLLAMKGDGDE